MPQVFGVEPTVFQRSQDQQLGVLNLSVPLSLKGKSNSLSKRKLY